LKIGAYGLLGACLMMQVPMARAQDRYYLLVFSAQHCPNLPRYSHSFATFVHAGTKGLECQTISWLPATLVIRPCAPDPEPGRRLELQPTLAWAKSNDTTISLWGPYQVCPELYEKSLCRIRYLDTHAHYKAIDFRMRPLALDCIHAISGVDRDPGSLKTGTAHGDEGSYRVLLHLKRWIIDPCHTHDWLLEPLGLACEPLCRRCWEGPRLLRYREPSGGSCESCEAFQFGGCHASRFAGACR
jgi:hypothetical protein